MIKKENEISKIVIFIIVFFVGCGSMYGIIAAFPHLFSVNVTKLEKDVTVTDSGIADAVEKVYDAVVVVSTYKDNKLYSTGTGFVYKIENQKAYIITNNHVVESGSKVTVTFTDGRVVETEIIGKDALSDIAVLGLKEKDVISVAELGNSNDLRVGDTTFAVGAPLDSVYSWTVTRGILSGKDRMVEVELSGEYVMKVLQTDAAINSGNSGGPLCNSNGEVIGVASLKLVDESVEGMGFAIPIEVAIEYASKLISGEVITQPYLGVSMINVTDGYYYPQYYKILNEYNITSGVIVYEVAKNSPAEKAGLKSGDIITKVNNDNVTSIGYLRYYLYNYDVGAIVNITYIRGGKNYTATLTLGKSETMY